STPFLFLVPCSCYLDHRDLHSFPTRRSSDLPMIGRDAFQETDIVGITLPITKKNYLVEDVTDLADIVAEAMAIAVEGRPGPVLIDVPKDVQNQKIEWHGAQASAAPRAGARGQGGPLTPRASAGSPGSVEDGVRQ